MNFHKVQFNGSFMHENVYRQGAGPEVDEAWEALGVMCKYGCISADRQRIEDLDEC